MLLGLISLLTSLIAGVLGLGGGMLLIAILPVFLPPQAIIPVHAVTQLSSNGSRAFFARQHIQWQLVRLFVLGSLLGVLIFGLVLFSLPARWIPLFIGSYILLSLWCPPFERWIRKYENLFSAGIFQTGLGLIVGATGPLTTTILTKTTSCKESIVATNAVLMLISHIAKIIVFGLVGFAYVEYLWLMLSMISGAVLGSYLGTKVRNKVDNQLFATLLKWVLTALAVKMLLLFGINLGGIFVET